MFYKKLDNGKYRFFEKYFDENQGKWRQVTVTMNSKSRVSQSEAKKRLSKKIEKRIKESSASGSEILPTVQEVFDEWRIIRDQELKPSSQFVEMSAFSVFLREFGNLKIREVTTVKVQKFFMELRLAPTTLSIRKTYYRLLFSYAKRIGYVESNPIENIVLPKVKMTHEQIQRKKEKFLDKREMRKLLDYLYQDKWHFRKALMFEFLFLTGLRIGELLALKWEDIDFDNQKLYVRHTLNVHGVPARNRELLSPKTSHSYRSLMLDNRSMEIIDFFASGHKDENFVFVGMKKQTYGHTTLSKVFKKACTEVLGEGQYNLHMLRHSHISLLVEMNVPIKAIMERVGHSDEKMILQIYSHVTENIQRDLLAKMNDLTF
ncbi:site-specific integrase [uncultured Lactococcus sp.]|uniref:tyrosine-type recombinase/integrase n=1 Tax=uncultured Lactococcus sp. TaxID=167973 RepID=UPI0027DAEB7B|nr:site-specific integrase [uncultured Lactococcus sp.]